MSLPDLSRKLVLEEAQRVPDGAGGHLRSWIALGEHWADVRPAAGRERAGELVTISSVGCRIIVRAAPVGSAARPPPTRR